MICTNGRMLDLNSVQGNQSAEIDSIAARIEWLGAEAMTSIDLAESLPGLWRLVYSSAFTSGNLGGSRPGPQASLLPTQLGQVYQRVDREVMTSKVGEGGERDLWGSGNAPNIAAMCGGISKLCISRQGHLDNIVELIISSPQMPDFGALLSGSVPSAPYTSPSVRLTLRCESVFPARGGRATTMKIVAREMSPMKSHFHNFTILQA